MVHLVMRTSDPMKVYQPDLAKVALLLKYQGHSLEIFLDGVLLLDFQVVSTQTFNKEVLGLGPSPKAPLVCVTLQLCSAIFPLQDGQPNPELPYCL